MKRINILLITLLILHHLSFAEKVNIETVKKIAAKVFVENYPGSDKDEIIIDSAIPFTTENDTLFYVLQFITYGQVETGFFPNGNALNQVIIIKNYPEANIVKKFPSFNVQELIDEDNQLKGLDVPFRFGKGFDTEITLNIGSNGNYKIRNNRNKFSFL